jgi:hypothetical protein
MDVANAFRRAVSMPEKKYIVIGDYVIAKDGDKHFISASRLILLYKLDRESCIQADITRPETLRGLPDLPRYYPRSDENYE